MPHKNKQPKNKDVLEKFWLKAVTFLVLILIPWTWTSQPGWGGRGRRGVGGVVVVKREEKKQYLCKLDELIKRMLITLSNDGNLKSGEEETGK